VRHALYAAVPMTYRMPRFTAPPVTITLDVGLLIVIIAIASLIGIVMGVWMERSRPPDPDEGWDWWGDDGDDDGPPINPPPGNFDWWMDELEQFANRGPREPSTA